MSENEIKPISLTGPQLEGVALSTIRAVLGHVRYQYLSGPITGGRRLLDWHEAEGRHLDGVGYKAAKKLAVKNKNIEAVQALARDEREANRATIEPGSFEADFPHWGQREFLSFWEKVIEHHAADVKFMEGWQYSGGCTFEFLCARKHGVATYDQAGHLLTNQAAIALLDVALDEIASRHDPSDPRDEEIAALHAGILESRGKIAGLNSEG